MYLEACIPLGWSGYTLSIFSTQIHIVICLQHNWNFLSHCRITIVFSRHPTENASELDDTTPEVYGEQNDDNIGN